MRELYKTLARYCEENIWEYELRLQLALTQMDQQRAPLRMVDGYLYSDILGAIEDWGLDNDTDTDCIDVEDIIFA